MSDIGNRLKLSITVIEQSFVQGPCVRIFFYKSATGSPGVDTILAEGYESQKDGIAVLNVLKRDHLLSGLPTAHVTFFEAATQ
jgi:hypothetical protein